MPILTRVIVAALVLSKGFSFLHVPVPRAQLHPSSGTRHTRRDLVVLLSIPPAADSVSEIPAKEPISQPSNATAPPESPLRNQAQPKFDEFEQKLESIKGALLGGVVGSTCRLLSVGVGAIPLLPPLLRDSIGVPEPEVAAVLFGLGAGALHGALFALTYRYVVRSDRAGIQSQGKGADDGESLPEGSLNVGQLGDGAVAAFALVATLGQSEGPLTAAVAALVDTVGQGGDLPEAVTLSTLVALPFIPRLIGSLFLFTAVRMAVDRALDEGLILPFPGRFRG